MKKRRHPDWLRIPMFGGENFSNMKKLLKKSNLNTICEEAKCPNITECFANKTAVFLILGDVCTRNCKYCNVKHGLPLELNKNEPKEVANSVVELDLKYVVITSVTRDDLNDGGSMFFFETVKEIRKLSKNCKIEVLIPDFKGDIDSLNNIINAKPDVINHNIEVCEELFSYFRPQGDYNISLKLLKYIRNHDKYIKSKSGFMIGLGEEKKDIFNTIKDLRKSKVDFLTIGQYLQPSFKHVEVKKYYSPEEFQDFKKFALKLGFKHVESGPLVRSSYHAERVFN